MARQDRYARDSEPSRSDVDISLAKAPSRFSRYLPWLYVFPMAFVFLLWWCFTDERDFLWLGTFFLLPILVISAVIAFHFLRLQWSFGYFTWRRICLKPAALAAKGRLKEAEAAYHAAIRKAREFSISDCRRGMIFYALAEFKVAQDCFDEADALFQQALDSYQNPTSEHASSALACHSNYATYLLHRGRENDAASLYREAIDIAQRLKNPALSASVAALLRSNLATVYIDRERFADARLLLDEAKELSKLFVPRDGEPISNFIHITWARWYLAQDRLAEAKSQLERVKNFRHPSVYSCWASLHLARHDLEQAERCFRKADEAASRGVTRAGRPEDLRRMADSVVCQIRKGDGAEALRLEAAIREIIDRHHVTKGPQWRRWLKAWSSAWRTRDQIEHIRRLEQELLQEKAVAAEPSTHVQEKQASPPASSGSATVN